MKLQDRKLFLKVDTGIVILGKEVIRMTPFRKAVLDDGTKNWYKRKADPSTICVHWGGLNSRHCYNVFNLARGRHVSSHLTVHQNSL